jgi:protein-S-isoprenylcysteine O-methyltransferase Ste14
MRASALEFRLRMAINAVIIILGFWAPWIEKLGIGRRISLIEWLGLGLSRIGAMSFAVATTMLIVCAAVFAALGALFRVWGTAYLGPSTVNNIDMIAGGMMADGPYRYVRNPLYLGLWFMVAAMAFLMPVSGAAFAMVLITVFAIRLTLGEEVFLRRQLGEPYVAYLRAVPRFIPRLRGALVASGAKPHWARSMMAELTPIGIFVAILIYSRNYDIALAGRTILIFFGASLVVRAFIPSVVIKSEPAN